jgi:hypothetical protein
MLCLFNLAANAVLKYPVIGLCICIGILYLRPDTRGAANLPTINNMSSLARRPADTASHVRTSRVLSLLTRIFVVTVL